MNKFIINLAIASSFTFSTALYADCIKAGSDCVVSGSGEPVRSITSSSDRTSRQVETQRSGKFERSNTSMRERAKPSATSIGQTSSSSSKRSGQASDSMPHSSGQSDNSTSDISRQSGSSTPVTSRHAGAPSNSASQPDNARQSIPNTSMQVDPSQRGAVNAFVSPGSDTSTIPAYSSTCCWAP